MRPNKGLLARAWVHVAHPRAAEAQGVLQTGGEANRRHPARSFEHFPSAAKWKRAAGRDIESSPRWWVIVGQRRWQRCSARSWRLAGSGPVHDLVAAAEGWHARGTQKFMGKRTLEQLDAALLAVSKDLAPRVEELAQKSTAGALTPEELHEYAEVVRLNDTLSLLKLQAEEVWTMRAGS